jgi:hypothetical protein
MMGIPIRISPTEFDITVVLEPENIARMREHDPAELVKKLYGPPWTGLQIRNIAIAFLPTEEREEFLRRLKQDPLDGLRWLSRGFKYRPDRGDADTQYERQ